MKLRRDLGIGSELKVSVDAGLERLKVICCWEDGRRKRVPISRCHRDKRVGECVCSVSIQFKRVGVLGFNNIFTHTRAFLFPGEKPAVSSKTYTLFFRSHPSSSHDFHYI